MSARVEARILKNKQQISGGGGGGRIDIKDVAPLWVRDGGQNPLNLNILPPIPPISPCCLYLKIKMRVGACFARFGISVVGH